MCARKGKYRDWEYMGGIKLKITLNITLAKGVSNSYYMSKRPKICKPSHQNLWCGVKQMEKQGSNPMIKALLDVAT